MADPPAQEAMPTGDPALFDQAHRQLLADGSIQFDLPAFKPDPPPAWLLSIGEFLDGLGPFLTFLFWVVVAALALAFLYLIYRWLEGRGFVWRRRKREAPAEEAAWRPREAPARALLSDADALAAAGDYAAAAHLLLHRSIEEIDGREPDLVRPALTSRDIAGAPALPPGPSGAFARIVMAVEKSLFGRRPLDAEEWRDCRAAYENFAFSPEWKA